MVLCIAGARSEYDSHRCAGVAGAGHAGRAMHRRCWRRSPPAFTHACGLTVDGTALCAGTNGNGQLGDGTTTDRTAPVQVTGNLRFTTLTAGNNFTCGIATDGFAYCWGANSFGQLGTTGTPNGRSTPGACLGNVRVRDACRWTESRLRLAQRRPNVLLGIEREWSARRRDDYESIDADARDEIAFAQGQQPKSNHGIHGSRHGTRTRRHSVAIRGCFREIRGCS
jgi:hypothetical protein